MKRAAEGELMKREKERKAALLTGRRVDGTRRVRKRAREGRRDDLSSVRLRYYEKVCARAHLCVRGACVCIMFACDSKPGEGWN